MVAIQRGRQKSGMTTCFSSVILFGCFGIIFYIALSTNDQSILAINKDILQKNVLSLEPEIRAMRLWKLQLQGACTRFLESRRSESNFSQNDLLQKHMIESNAMESLILPDPESFNMSSGFSSSSSSSKVLEYPQCNHIFIDLGSNRGDSIGCAVDASLDVCSELFVERDSNLIKMYRISRDFPRLHFNVTDLQVHQKGSKALSLLRVLQKFFQNPGMESVCAYGMEGNPYFTQKLQEMQFVIENMTPKPLKHVKIFTETIVSPTDGPASLYLDQFSEKNHFWGSSVLKSMPDVRKTSNQNNGTIIEAKVEGMTLSTLLRNTLGNHLQPNLESGRPSKGSLLVKIDVEGAEFGVLKEVSSSQILCDYTKYGNNATFIVEFHQHLIKDPIEKKEAVAGIRDAKDKLRQCGVKFRNLPNYWT